MPALSPTMTAGNIAKWMVKPGDKVGPGDHLCDVETDKATMGWEAQEEGYVAAILRADGSNEVPVGEIVLVLCDEAKDVAAFKVRKESPGGRPTRCLRAGMNASVGTICGCAQPACGLGFTV